MVASPTMPGPPPQPAPDAASPDEASGAAAGAPRAERTSPAGDGREIRAYEALMPHAVQRVLLVASDYDFFILEEEGRFSDRLLGQYEARPVLARLRATLGGAGVALVALASVLVASPVAPDGGRVAPRLAGGVPLYSRAVASPADLAVDDDAAEAEAEAQAGRPGWCGDEVLRAAAGGAAAVCR